MSCLEFLDSSLELHQPADTVAKVNITIQQPWLNRSTAALVVLTRLTSIESTQHYLTCVLDIV